MFCLILFIDEKHRKNLKKKPKIQKQKFIYIFQKIKKNSKYRKSENRKTKLFVFRFVKKLIIQIRRLD